MPTPRPNQVVRTKTLVSSLRIHVLIARPYIHPCVEMGVGNIALLPRRLTVPPASFIASVYIAARYSHPPSPGTRDSRSTMAMSLFPHLRSSPCPARQYLFSLGLRLTSSPAKNGLPACHTPTSDLILVARMNGRSKPRPPALLYSSQPPFHTVGEGTSLIPLPSDSVSSRRAGPPPSEIQGSTLTYIPLRGKVQVCGGEEHDANDTDTPYKFLTLSRLFSSHFALQSLLKIQHQSGKSQHPEPCFLFSSRLCCWWHFPPWEPRRHTTMVWIHDAGVPKRPLPRPSRRL
jgi:hypothetical protein